MNAFLFVVTGLVVLVGSSFTAIAPNMGAVRCRERLGGMLKYYEREAA